MKIGSTFWNKKTRAIIKLLNDKYLLFCHSFFTCILISEEKNKWVLFLLFFSLNNTCLFSEFWMLKVWNQGVSSKGEYLSASFSFWWTQAFLGLWQLNSSLWLFFASVFFLLIRTLLAFRFTVYSKFSIWSRYFYQCICKDSISI